MRNTFKKILCSLLVIVMCFTAVPFVGFDFTAEAAEYKVGDIIQFGSYPQTEVKDEALVAELNALAPEWEDWTSYGYYSGTAAGVGTMKQGDWMRYTDVTYNGIKYRGVKFIQYRPYHTLYEPSSSHTTQVNNGYATNRVYWFKFMAIDWRVLDPETGFVMSETIIDSQPYSNTVYYNSGVSDLTYDHFNDSEYENYASDYETSFIRKWLNEDFYNTAFTEAEKKEINTTVLNNDSYNTLLGITGYEKLDSNPTNDKIFLLSYNEVINSNYGFDSDQYVWDIARRTQGSDYAKCQGLNVYISSDVIYNGNSSWLLRSPGDNSLGCRTVFSNGFSESSSVVICTDQGIRPAMRLNLSSGKEEYETGDIIQFGSYPQTEVEDEALVAELNALAPEWEDWTSYGYYSGEGDYGTMVQGDWMRYTDITYNGNKYRGVKFTQYRPEMTWNLKNADNSKQDDNGYSRNIAYWFVFEPIEWRVLDSDLLLVMSESIIDAQPYSNLFYSNAGAYFNDLLCNNYANDYATSSIRQWLNDDFYNAAFTVDEKNVVSTTNINNDGYYTSIGVPGFEVFDSIETKDKVFLLSYNEAKNSKFGFDPDCDKLDAARRAKGSSYAECQGLTVSRGTLLYGDVSCWRLRSAGMDSYYCCIVSSPGTSGGYQALISSTGDGIRPALRLNEWPEISQPEHTCNYISEITKQPTHLEYGEMTYTCEGCGDTYTEKLDRLSEHNLLIDERKANCFDPGYVRYFCECGYEYFDSYTEALGHSYLREVITEPTHLEYGEATYTCERCGDNYREKLDKLEGHIYEEVVTKSTCTEPGYATYICKCGYSYVGNHTEATGHAYYSEVTKEPTHLEYGEITYICKNCGDNYSEKLDKIEEHTYEGFITTPSCAEKGYTTYICECGKNYADNYVDATGHADKNADGVCDGCSYDFTEGCDCGCHKSGIAGFFFKLKLIFQKIFKRNAICDCGAKHY